MRYTVEFSTEAEITYAKNISFLLERWTVKEAQTFIEKVNDILVLLASSPEIGIAVKGKRIRKINAVPQVSVYYKIEPKNNIIEIITFWNNYQSPAKLKI